MAQADTTLLRNSQPGIAPLIDDLVALLGPQHVLSDPEELRFYSTDIYRRADIDAELVVRPGTLDELAAAIKLCGDAGVPIIARGGGLSYTGGFLPTCSQSVIFDTLRLNRIVEVNTTDMYVTVECGVTWKDLYERLKGQGVRTPYFGPMSGYASTIGGALSQGSVFLGSTQYGTTADSVLGVEMYLPDGSRVQTGSSGGVKHNGPFFRNYGPDLTGLFLHDAGALGIKGQATLRLIRTPAFTESAAFTFGNQADLLTAMSQIARRGLAAECFGADPYIWGMRLWDDDIVRDIKRVVGVAKNSTSLVSGVKNAVRIAMTGRQALSDVEYAMNLTVDGGSLGEIETKLAEIRTIALATGKAIEPTVPRAIRGAPFLPPNDILGPKGQRWSPSHGIIPHSRAIAVLDAMTKFLGDRAEEFARHGIEWGYVVFAVSNSGILIEPMLYWPDAREPYHERVIEKAFLAKLPVMEPHAQSREAMQSLRNDLVAFWTEQGCAHLQIGKTYDFFDNRAPEVRALLTGIKALVDPKGLVNPGALGMAN